MEPGHFIGRYSLTNPPHINRASKVDDFQHCQADMNGRYQVYIR